MANKTKYFIILESLQFPVVGEPKDGNLQKEQRIKHNLKVLQKCIKLTPEEVIESIINDQELKHLVFRKHDIIESHNDNFLYSVYLLKTLLEICRDVKFSSDAREDLVSERHKSLIISSLDDLASIYLEDNLHDAFYNDKAKVFQKQYKKETNFCQLEFFIEVLSTMLHIKSLHVGKSLDDVQLRYMAAIFSLFIAVDSKDYQMEPLNIANLQGKLQKMWLELSKKLYYRNLMVMFATLQTTHKQRIHREMLLRLQSSGGFMALLFAMADTQGSAQQGLDELIAGLVAQPNYSAKSQLSLINQILQFLKVSLKSKELLPFMGAGILSLRKLYDNRRENKEYLNNWLKKEIMPLVEIEDAGLIAMEWLDFTDLISLLFHIFCSSSIATLPSEMLVPWLAVLLELYNQVLCFANQDVLINHLSGLILRTMNNRSNEELKYIIKCLALKSCPAEWYLMHRKIHIKENPLNMQELKLSKSEGESMTMMEHKNYLGSLISIVKLSSYNLLIYQHFIMLLQLVPSQIMYNKSSTSKDKSTNIDLLQTEEDLYNKVLIEFSQNYECKFEILKALESLVQHQTLKTLINDNITEILKVLGDILTAYTTVSKEMVQADINSAVLMILLILIREIVESCSLNVGGLQAALIKPLKLLESQILNENVKFQLRSLLKYLQGEPVSSGRFNSTKNQFEDARSLIECNESYLQVEGIENMIKLLNKREQIVLGQCHILTALALNTLKSSESYTFLNCVRLFVALVNVAESEVLELLSDEYLNEAADMDFRLVVGEAILKTSRELGPLCYKYKNVLLNNFMTGCRSHLDEFRLSAFSNLSQLCCILAYQVHNYFQELLQLINCELTTGSYLPAKRAAVMVLSDLLAGMDNLFDYEEMLLPIYRLLKFLVVSETNDEKIRIHASNGLKSLSEKCKELFRAALEHERQGSLEKEINILGIRDKSKKNLKNHILEMN